MAQKSIPGNKILAERIKLRRNELGLTIEEAASRASVGTKTWCRYEAGNPIRIDKCKGICKALNWSSLPNASEDDNEQFSIEEYQNHEAWSPFLNNKFGAGAAVAFAAGSDIVLDQIEEDMAELSSMPIGTHLGQLDISWLRHSLPEQFLMQYNYDFLYQMKCTLLKMRRCAKYGAPMTAHSVMEELLLYLCYEESSFLLELSGDPFSDEDEDTASEDWLFDLFGDMDIITCLYSNWYLDADHSYHFSHWQDQQFYTNERNNQNNF